MDLEIAQVCAQAGFNTWHHNALLDLIWSVKRVARRTIAEQISGSQRRPQDSIYPDRYRPSGLGDNTSRKRKTLHTSGVVTDGTNTQRIIETRGSDQTFVDDQCSNLNTLQDESKNFGRNGTAAASIEAANVSKSNLDSKSRKRNGQKKTKVFSTTTSELDPDAKNASHEPVVKRQKRHDQGCTVSVSQPLTIVQTHHHRSGHNLEHDLRSVHQALRVVGERVDACFKIMKRAWDESPVLGEDGVMPSLYSLRDKLMEVMNGSAQARRVVNEIRHWVGLHSQVKNSCMDLS